MTESTRTIGIGRGARMASSAGQPIPDGYLPLPSPRNPWYLIPMDDGGPIYYFVLYVLSSRRRGRRLIVRVLRLAVLLGLHRLWPRVAPVLSWVVQRRA